MAGKENPIIIDTHAHVIPRFLKDNEVDEIAIQMAEERVLAINVAPTIDCQEEANEIAKQYPWLLPTAGFHGLFASQYKDGDHREIEELMTNQTSAIGPVGLDFHEGTTVESKRLQMQLIVSQERLARKHNLPIILHVRYDLETNIELIKKFPQVRFVLIGWYGDTAQTKDLLKRTNKNVWFVFGGRVTHTKKENSTIPREVLKAIPQNRILLGSGTPSPDTIPQNLLKKEKISKPWFVRDIAKWMATSLKVSQENFIKKCNNNAVEAFGLDPKFIANDSTLFDSLLKTEETTEE